MAVAVAYLRPTAGSGLVPEAIIPEPAFEIFGFDTAVAGGRVVRVMPNADFRFAEDAVLAAITPQTRVVFLTNPNNPTGVPVPLEAIRNDRPARAAGGGRLRGRGVRRVRRRDRSSRSCRVPERHRRPHVLEGVRPRRPADRRARRRPGHARSGPARDPGLQREHRGGRRRCRRRSATSTYLQEYLRQVQESKALLYAACDRLGLHVLAERRQLRARPRRRPHRRGDRRRARERGIYLRDRSTEPGCAGCLRIATGLRRPHAARHRGARGGPVRRAVIDRRTTETQIALTLDLDGKGRYDVRTGIRFLDHMLELFARHGAFDLTHRRDRRSRRRSAPHRRGSRHRARRGGVEGARRRGAASTAPATS